MEEGIRRREGAPPDYQAYPPALKEPAGVCAVVVKPASRRPFSALAFGIVGINAGIISTEVAPFGGMKESGFGWEDSKYGINECLNIRYPCIELHELLS